MPFFTLYGCSLDLRVIVIVILIHYHGIGICVVILCSFLNTGTFVKEITSSQRRHLLQNRAGLVSKQRRIEVEEDGLLLRRLRRDRHGSTGVRRRGSVRLLRSNDQRSVDLGRLLRVRAARGGKGRG